ncbi:hypothetical protein EON65_15255 [archaeon]|nr:MAG: hypothetical protein EON65_15255 [archaeon]
MKVIAFSAGCEHSAAITADGEVYTWGHGDGGRLGIGSNSQSFVPLKVDALSSMKLKSKFVHCGDKFTAVLCEPRGTSGRHQQSQIHATELFVDRENYDALIKEVMMKEGKEVNPADSECSKDVLMARLDFFSSLSSEEQSEVQLLCSDVAASLLHCMMVAGVYRIPLTSIPLSCLKRQYADMLARDTLTASLASLSDDCEYCTEISEDTYINISLLLEATTARYCKHLHALALNGQSDPSIVEEVCLSGKSASPKKQRVQLSESLVVSSSELKAQFEVLHNLLVVCCVNMVSLDTVVKSTCEGKREVEIEQALKSNFLQFALRREDVAKEDYGKVKSKQLNDALSYHSQESDEGSLSLQDDADSGVFEKSAVRQRNHSHRSHFTKEYSLRDEDEDILSKGESTDFDNDGSLDDSLSQEGSLHDQHESRENGDLMSTVNTGYSTLTGDVPVFDVYAGRDGLTRQMLQQGTLDNYSIGVDLNTVEDNHSLSPAPSYESLENSLDEKKGDVDGFVQDRSNIRDPYGLVEDLPGREDTESVEFQQALLSSIANSQKGFVPNKYLKKIETKRGQACMTGIRTHINTLASHCFVAIRNAAGLDSLFDYDGMDNDILRSIHQAIVSVFSVWEAAQVVTSVGFSLLYNITEQHSILNQVMQSPSSFLYILPGLVSGMKRCSSLQGYMSSFFTADYLFEASIDDITMLDGPNAEKSILRMEDVMQVLEHFQSLYSSDAFSPMDWEDIKPQNLSISARSTKECACRMITSIRMAFSELVGSFLLLVLSSIRSYSRSTMHVAPSDIFSQHTKQMYSQVTESIKMEILFVCQMATFNGGSWLTRSYLQSTMTQLILPILSSDIGSDGNIYHLCAVFPFGNRILNFLAQQTSSVWLCKNSMFARWIERQTSLVLQLLASTVTVLCRPPRHWFPIHPLSAQPFRISAAFSPLSSSTYGLIHWKALCDQFITHPEVNTWCMMPAKLIGEGVGVAIEANENSFCMPISFTQVYPHLQAASQHLLAAGLFDSSNRALSPSFVTFSFDLLKKLNTTLSHTDQSLLPGVPVSEEVATQMLIVLYAVIFSSSADCVAAPVYLLAALCHVYIVGSHVEDEEYNVDTLAGILNNLYRNLSGFLQVSITESEMLASNLLKAVSANQCDVAHCSAAINNYLRIVDLHYDVVVYDAVEEDQKDLTQSKDYHTYTHSPEAIMLQVLTKYQTTSSTYLNYHISITLWQHAKELNKVFGISLLNNICIGLKCLPLELREGFYDQLCSLGCRNSDVEVPIGTWLAYPVASSSSVIGQLLMRLVSTLHTEAQACQLSFRSSGEQPNSKLSAVALVALNTVAYSVREALYLVDILLSFIDVIFPSYADSFCVLFDSMFTLYTHATAYLHTFVATRGVFQEGMEAMKHLQAVLVLMKDTSIIVKKVLDKHRVSISAGTGIDRFCQKLVKSMLPCLLAQEKVMTGVYRKCESHFQLCEHLGSVYLCSKDLALGSQSPVISSGLCAPDACFSISLHLYLPEHLTTKSCEVEEGGKMYIHLLSRVAENGDIRMADLVRLCPSKLDSYTLSVHLVYEPSRSQKYNVYLQINFVTYQVEFDQVKKTTVPNASNMKKTTVKHSFQSPVLCPGWHSILMEFQQSQNSVRSVSPLDEVAGNLGTKSYDSTHLLLYVDGDIVLEEDVSGGRWPMYQSLLLGKLPENLGFMNHKREDDVVSGCKYDDVVVADVLWIPTIVRPQDILHPTLHATLAYPCSSLISLLTISNSSFATTLSTFRELSKHCSDVFHLHISDQLLVYIPALLNLLVVSNSTTQQQVLYLLQDIVALFPDMVLNALTMSHAATREDLENSIDSTSGPVGSTANAVYTFKLNNVLVSMFTVLLSILVSFIQPNVKVDTKPAENCSNVITSVDSWWRRMYYNRISLDQLMNSTHWMPILHIDENILLIGISILFNKVIKNFYNIFSSNFQKLYSILYSLLQHIGDKYTTQAISKVCIDLLYSINIGGWFPVILLNTKVQIHQRCQLIYYLSNLPHVSAGSALYQSNDVLLETSEIDYIDVFKRPCGQHNSHYQQLLLSSAFVNNTNLMQKIYHSHMYRLYDMSTFNSLCWQNSLPVNNIYISRGLHSSHALHPTHNYFPILYPQNNQIQLLQSELVTTHDNFDYIYSNSIMASIIFKQIGSYSSKEIQAILKSIISINKQTQFTVDDTSMNQNPLHELMMVVSNLRSLSVLFYQTMSEGGIAGSLDSMKKLVATIQPLLSHLVSIASLDPIEAASQIFVNCNFKGVQVDVLRNLLRESDILFLEKLSSKLFKQFDVYTQYEFSQTYVASQHMNVIQLVPLAGEVYIGENKVRAISHFPSVRLLNINLCQLTGRWYYEVTLLSDGLMQIGWANTLFKCDPICGQGVGDHNQSWAYDGLRTKKWNVSCEPYGKRWLPGDIVGVLVDMDLLEMKFFLNGRLKCHTLY